MNNNEKSSSVQPAERAVWQQDNEREKKRFLVRKQEEREQLRALKDFLRHSQEEGWDEPEAGR